LIFARSTLWRKSLRNNFAFVGLLLLGFTANAAAIAVAATPQAAGGANQRPSVEGCLNEWLFNGVERVRALDVTPDGTLVTLEVRNGTTQTLSAPDAGFAKINGQGIDLAYSDGSVQNLDISATAYRDEIGYKKLPPGGGTTVKLRFAPPASTSAKPAKLLIAVDPTYNSYVHYTVKDPSFRINVNCTK
jgi:hypothetical protein